MVAWTSKGSRHEGTHIFGGHLIVQKSFFILEDIGSKIMGHNKSQNQIRWGSIFCLFLLFTILCFLFFYSLFLSSIATMLQELLPSGRR